jgi:hypothetical protein
MKKVLQERARGGLAGVVLAEGKKFSKIAFFLSCRAY